VRFVVRDVRGGIECPPCCSSYHRGIPGWIRSPLRHGLRSPGGRPRAWQALHTQDRVRTSGQPPCFRRQARPADGWPRSRSPSSISRRYPRPGAVRIDLLTDALTSSPADDGTGVCLAMSWRECGAWEWTVKVGPCGPRYARP
jgi:hypothetical protein